MKLKLWFKGWLLTRSCANKGLSAVIFWSDPARTASPQCNPKLFDCTSSSASKCPCDKDNIAKFSSSLQDAQKRVELQMLPVEKTLGGNIRCVGCRTWQQTVMYIGCSCSVRIRGLSSNVDKHGSLYSGSDHSTGAPVGFPHFGNSKCRPAHIWEMQGPLLSLPTVAFEQAVEVEA